MTTFHIDQRHYRDPIKQREGETMNKYMIAAHIALLALIVAVWLIVNI